MRRGSYVLVVAVALVLGLGGLLTAVQAAGMFTGTWKLNPARSKYTAGAPPKEETVTFADVGDQETATVNGTAADGSPMSGKYTMPMKGGMGTATDSPWDGVSSKVVSDSVRDVTYMKGGKAMLHLHAVVSKSGKAMRVTVSGMNPRGQQVAGVSVFRKQ
jgi:hypothetical protein